jgi:hypothetical protein
VRPRLLHHRPQVTPLWLRSIKLQAANSVDRLWGRISKSGPVFVWECHRIAFPSPLALRGHKLDPGTKEVKLILPVAPLHRIDELPRVEADAVFEDDFDVLDI